MGIRGSFDHRGAPSRIRRAAGAVAVAMSLGACAGTVPGADFTRPLPADLVLAASDTVAVRMDAVEGVEMLATEKARLEEKVAAAVGRRKAGNPGGGRAFEIRGTVTDYSKGNAFARAMLAGLGQMHIDATVALHDAASQESLCEFELSKTFAWGGIYGASTSIEDIEDTFAEGVAEAVVPQSAGAAPQTEE
jgi:hypothetical protein